MSRASKFFPSQRENEEVFLLLRRHWFTYIPFLLIGLFMAAPLAILAVYLAMNRADLAENLYIILVVLGSAYSLFILSLLLFGFIDYYLDVDIVTNQRIVDIEQNGFFKRKISELSLEQVEDVTAKVNGFFATLLHFGDVEIQTAGTRPNFIFHSVPHPYRISKIILDLQDAAKSHSPKRQAEVYSMLKGTNGGVGESLQPKTIANAPDQEERVRAPYLPEVKQERILTGLAHDEEMVKTGEVVLEGTLKEGEEADI